MPLTGGYQRLIPTLKKGVRIELGAKEIQRKLPKQQNRTSDTVTVFEELDSNYLDLERDGNIMLMHNGNRVTEEFIFGVSWSKST